MSTSTILSLTQLTSRCRHSLIGSHFEEDNNIKCIKACDNCMRKATIELYDLNRACTEIYRTIEDATKKESDLTLLKLIDSWYKLHDVPITKDDAESVVAHLLRLRILKEEKCYTTYNVICYFKKNYEIPPEEGMDVRMVKNSPLRGYLGPPPDARFMRKRKFDDFCQPSTSKVKVEKIGE